MAIVPRELVALNVLISPKNKASLEEDARGRQTSISALCREIFTDHYKKSNPKRKGKTK